MPISSSKSVPCGFCLAHRAAHKDGLVITTNNCRSHLCTYEYCENCLADLLETYPSPRFYRGSEKVDAGLSRQAKQEPSGFKKFDGGKVQMGLIPPTAIRETAEVATFGGAKYEPWNYLRGTDYSRYVDAIHRHINAFELGEDADPEHGKHPLAALAMNALMLLEMIRRGVGNDNRAHKLLAAWSTEELLDASN